VARQNQEANSRTNLHDPASVPHAVHAPDVAAGDQRYPPISDYAMVGNAQSAALISSDGSVDWLCLPHFDSPAVLCRMLDIDIGGYLAIRPAHTVISHSRAYRKQSNVLDTGFQTDVGELILTDAMPLATGKPSTILDGVWSGHGRHRLVRLMEACEGDIHVTLDARIGFDFAATAPHVEVIPGKGAILTDGNGCWLGLAWPGDLQHDDDGVFHGTLTLHSSQIQFCVLGYERDEAGVRRLLDRTDWADEVQETDDGWREWASQLDVSGPYAGAMTRSALTLRMMTFEPTGALIAAPTTSLPETIGGVRNWDYRFCWLRDATLILYALLLLGDGTAAKAFWTWIEQTCAGQKVEDLQIMYGIHGDRTLTERSLHHLSGYRDSRPVRVGNAAYQQRQLDVFGELIDALWFYVERGGEDGTLPKIDPAIWHLMRDIADYLCDVWHEPDNGLWEIRGEPRHYVYSKVMCWVGLDRAVKLVKKHDGEGQVQRWSRERDALHAEICERGYNEEIGSFTMAYGTTNLDAAILRMPLVGFLPHDDPRIISTVNCIQRNLQVDGLVRRYTADDGLPGNDGAFSICTFWLVDCLTAIGRIDDAKRIFDNMLGLASDVGLFAEEVDPATGAMLGNYPQGFTHLALIDAGVDLTAALEKNSAVPGEHIERASQVRAGRAAHRRRQTVQTGGRS
jgi:GH15 family glucan-1,4-alpha-glucosidase